MTLCAELGRFQEIAEPGAEVAVANVGAQRPIERAALCRVEHARAFVADGGNAIEIKPQHGARIEIGMRTPHARHHAFVEIRMLAAALATITTAQHACGACHIAGKAIWFRTVR